jgi:hypothetical protein
MQNSSLMKLVQQLRKENGLLKTKNESLNTILGERVVSHKKNDIEIDEFYTRECAVDEYQRGVRVEFEDENTLKVIGDPICIPKQATCHLVIGSRNFLEIKPPPCNSKKCKGACCKRSKKFGTLERCGPKKIPNPKAKKPKNWNEEKDGPWKTPMIINPQYKKTKVNVVNEPRGTMYEVIERKGRRMRVQNTKTKRIFVVLADKFIGNQIRSTCDAFRSTKFHSGRSLIESWAKLCEYEYHSHQLCDLSDSKYVSRFDLGQTVRFAKKRRPNGKGVKRKDRSRNCVADQECLICGRNEGIGCDATKGILSKHLYCLDCINRFLLNASDVEKEKYVLPNGVCCMSPGCNNVYPWSVITRKTQGVVEAMNKKMKRDTLDARQYRTRTVDFWDGTAEHIVLEGQYEDLKQMCRVQTCACGKNFKDDCRCTVVNTCPNNKCVFNGWDRCMSVHCNCRVDNENVYRYELYLTEKESGNIVKIHPNLLFGSGNYEGLIQRWNRYVTLLYCTDGTGQNVTLYPHSNVKRYEKSTSIPPHRLNMVVAPSMANPILKKLVCDLKRIIPNFTTYEVHTSKTTQHRFSRNEPSFCIACMTHNVDNGSEWSHPQHSCHCIANHDIGLVNKFHNYGLQSMGIPVHLWRDTVLRRSFMYKLYNKLKMLSREKQSYFIEKLYLDGRLPGGKGIKVKLFPFFDQQFGRFTYMWRLERVLRNQNILNGENEPNESEEQLRTLKAWKKGVVFAPVDVSERKKESLLFPENEEELVGAVDFLESVLNKYDVQVNVGRESKPWKEATHLCSELTMNPDFLQFWQHVVTTVQKLV